MVIIDRFEEEWAVVEMEGKTEKILRSQLPDQAKEGDLLISSPAGWIIDEEGTAKRREMLTKLRGRVLFPEE